MNLSEDIKGLSAIRNELSSAALETSSTTHWSQQKATDHLQWALDQTFSVLMVRVFCVRFLRLVEWIQWVSMATLSIS